jgi:hypothetical protein
MTSFHNNTIDLIFPSSQHINDTWTWHCVVIFKDKHAGYPLYGYSKAFRVSSKTIQSFALKRESIEKAPNIFKYAWQAYRNSHSTRKRYELDDDHEIF